MNFPFCGLLASCFTELLHILSFSFIIHEIEKKDLLHSHFLRDRNPQDVSHHPENVVPVQISLNRSITIALKAQVI